MNITFEEADKIREALKPGATQDKRYEAIAILDVAEQKAARKLRQDSELHPGETQERQELRKTKSRNKKDTMRP